MSAILKFIRETHILALIEQAKVKKKSRLSLNDFEIADIPDMLFSCMDVEHLYLNGNNINVVPMQITELSNLTTLTLDYNNIEVLPPEIGNLKNLVNFNISYNPLKVLVPEIGELENLEAFWCNRIQLREIPKEIGKLSKLDTFGARGNHLTTIPEEMTRLKKLRWLTLEYNSIDTLPNSMGELESLVHCNLRYNYLKEFPMSLLQCADLKYLQFNNNQISSLPPDLDLSVLPVLEMIDLRGNPVCDLPHDDQPMICFGLDCPYLPGQGTDSAVRAQHAALAVQGVQIRLPQIQRLNNNIVQPPPDPMQMPVHDLELDASSIESSEDWENSVNSSELDMQYQSDEERADNEAIGMVLPELSRYASTAS